MHSNNSIKWLCACKTHCVTCRNDKIWRDSFLKFNIIIPDVCPHGITKATALSEETRALVKLAKTSEHLMIISKNLRQTSKSCCGQKNS